MKSDKILNIIGRFIPLLLGIVFIMRALEGYQMQHGELSLLFAAFIPFLIGISLIIGFLYLYRHFHLVELDNRGVSVLKNNNTLQIPWQQVRSITRYKSLLFLPFYKLQLADSDDFIIFGSHLKFWDIGNENVPVREINAFISNARTI